MTVFCPGVASSSTVLVEERRNQLLELVRAAGVCVAAGAGGAVAGLRVDGPPRPRLPGRVGTAKRTHGGVFYTGRFAQVAALRRAAAGPVGQEAADRRRGRRTDRRRRHGAAGRRQHDLRSGPAAGRPAAADRDQFAAGGQLVRLARQQRPGACWAATSIRGPACRWGRMPNEMLARLNVRRTVLSVAGINERGFFNSNLLLVETERAMMRGGRRSDRRGRQHEVRPSEPGPPVPAGRSRSPGGRRRDRRRLARASSRRPASKLHVAAPTDNGQQAA